jgi:hypothetical protein
LKPFEDGTSIKAMLVVSVKLPEYDEYRNRTAKENISTLISALINKMTNMEMTEWSQIQAMEKSKKHPEGCASM